MKQITLLVMITVASAVLAGATVLRSRPAPLAGTCASPEALAAAVLDGFVRRDRAALERLAISRREFSDHVWPVLPASRPERNLSAQFVWSDLFGKGRLHLTRNLAMPLPAGARVSRIDFRGETSRYGDLTIRRESVVTVIDRAGRPVDVRLFGSMLEQNGRFKVFSYVTD